MTASWARDIVLSNNVMLAGHTRIGDHVILGGGSAVQQFARVGRHAFVGGLAGVENDVIPYGLALGNRAYLGGLNLVGLKRRGFSPRGDPQPAARLSSAFRAGGHAEGSASTISRRNFPISRRCRRFSRSWQEGGDRTIVTPRDGKDAGG